MKKNKHIKKIELDKKGRIERIHIKKGSFLWEVFNL